MSWVDLFIAVTVVAAAFRGRATGALRQVGNLIGLATGFILGTWFAPSLAHHINSSTWRPLVAIGLVVVATSLGAAAGQLCGAAANKSLRQLRLGALDASVGAGLGVVSALVSCWLVAGLLVNTSWIAVASGINDSKVIVALDRIMPPVPSVEAKLVSLFRSADFPSVFAQVVSPTVPNVVTPSHSVSSAQVGTAANSVFKVIALGACGSGHEGTAFVIGRSMVVTNAHVIAGATSLRVDGRNATPLVVDSRHDVAILSVPGLVAPVLHVTDTPPRDTAAAIVGFPLNGQRTTTPAAVAGSVTAMSRGLYGGATYLRTLLVLTASVEPGNSGSPVFVNGKVIGMIVSRSTSQSTTAYAIETSVLAADLAAVRPHQSVGTGACFNG